MTMTDLYLRPEAVFEKTAGEVTLPEDPNAWPDEILQELFKQVPYVADFTPNVNMTKVDAERGYALGFIDIMNKTELQPSSSQESLQAAGVQRARVPIIVCDRKLQPFDLVLTEKNKTLPLTEERLGQVLFRPQTFDITSRSPGDMSIVGDLYPPYRQNFGFGGGGSTSSMGMGKQGSARGMINLTVIEELRETYKDAPLFERANFEKWAAMSIMDMAAAADKAKKVIPSGAVPKMIAGKGMLHGLPSASAVKGALPKTAGAKTAMGKLLGELVKKTTEPARMANISRLATSRGAQLAAEGGEAAKKGLKYTTIGNVAAQRMAKMSSAAKEAGFIGGMVDKAKGKVDKVKSHVKEQAGKALDHVAGQVGEAAGRAVGPAMAPATREGARTATREGVLGAREGLIDAGKDIWEKDKKKVVGGTAAAAGLIGANKAVNYGIKRHEDKRLAKDIGHEVKKASVLEVILSTINDSDYAKFASVVGRPEVQALMNNNSIGCRAALETLAGFEGGGLQKRAAAMPHAIAPTVVQIIATDEGYVVKTARHDVWAPHTYAADRGRIVRDFGTKIALAADQNGAVTAVEGGETPDEDVGGEMASITAPGVYTVETVEGESIEGWVIPNLLELDGTQMPIALFTNGSQMAVQGEIMGAPSSTEIPLAEGPPQGHGCFVRHNEDGELQATIPMEIKATINDQGEVLFSTETYDGRPVDVAVQPNIQEITMGPNGHVLIPESFQWMPLQGDSVALLSNPGDAGKTAAALRSIAGSVVVRAGDQNNISISGPLVEKVASAEREFVDLDQAMFLLGGLGVDPHYAATKIAYAVTYHKPIEVLCSRPIRTLSELRSESKEAAIKTLGQIPVLRRELFKEAAAIPDPVAVDTVLSLGFINPENITHFISFLPTLDDAQSKMCELLMGARLGMRDIPAGPLEKAIRSLEEVIRGLKVMAFAQN